MVLLERKLEVGQLHKVKRTVEIEKLVYGGSGLAHLEGSAIFVPFVLPDEVLDVSVSKGRAGTLLGQPRACLQPSEDRIEPPCPVFGQCGGCHYQHIPYERQCQFKEGILRESLQRIGGLKWEKDIEIVVAEPWGYRNRTQFHVARRNGRREVGFLKAGSHQHVAALHCGINSLKLNKLHEVLLGISADSAFPGWLRSVEFFTDEDKVQMNLLPSAKPVSKKFRDLCLDQLDGLRPELPLEYRCGEDTFRVSSRSFFQVNRFLLDRLVELAVGDSYGELALDLYCGVGLMSLPLARRHEKVIAVDTSASALRDLQHNTRLAGLNVRTIHMKVAEFLKGLEEKPGLVVADPPRSGLGAEVIEQLLRLAPQSMHLVSCNPATLARDLKLLAVGGYELVSLTLLDMFPQTFHIESVAVLQRCK